MGRSYLRIDDPSWATALAMTALGTVASCGNSTGATTTDGATSDVRVLADRPLPCGACATPANAVAECRSNECSYSCRAGFFDCDNEPSNGCETPESAEHCGACGLRCSAPFGATPSCASSACAFTCQAGFTRSGDRCVARVQPIRPDSGWLTETRTPTFRWSAPASAPSARIEVCRDRACSDTILRETVSPTSFTPTSPLPSGPLFWRVHALNGTDVVGTSPTWQTWIPRAPSSRPTVRNPVLDVDGDGWRDVLFCNARCAVWFNPFGGTNPGQVLLLPLSPTAGGSLVQLTPFVIGDANGDGYMDAEVTFAERVADSFLSHRTLILGAPNRSALRLVPSSPLRREDDFLNHGPGDINGDGFADWFEVETGGGLRISRGGATLESSIDPGVRLPGLRAFPRFRLFDGRAHGEALSVSVLSTTPGSEGHAIWAIDDSTQPPTVRERWSARDSLPVPVLGDMWSGFVPVGDMDGDRSPEFVAHSRDVLSAGRPAELHVLRSRSSASGAISFASIPHSIPFPLSARAFSIVGRFDLDADGRSEFAYVATGWRDFPRGAFEDSVYQLFVVTRDTGSAFALRALALGIGEVPCSFCIGFRHIGDKIPIPVAGDFDNDGFDDLIVPELGNRNLRILRGGENIEQLRWVLLPLTSPVVPTEFIGLQVS